MSLQTRIDNAEAQTLAGMAAEYDALVEAMAAILNDAKPEQRAAVERVATRAPKLPGDDDVLAGVWARLPPDFRSRGDSLEARGYFGADGKPRHRV